MKIPLFLTIGRMFISPLFLVCYLYHESLGIPLTLVPLSLLFLLLLSELSDFLDGYLARKFNLVTELGKILDPMADSVTRLTMLLTFTQGPIQLPLLLVFVFIYRDSVIGALRTICALKGMTLAARKSGKVKAAIQGVSIFCILFLLLFYYRGALSLGTLQKASMIPVSLAALYSLLSGVEYLVSNRHYLEQAWEKKR